MKKLLTLCVLLLPFMVMGQVKTFRWNDGVCDMESTYDGRKYTAQQLEHTRQLWQERSIILNTEVTAFKLDELENI